MDSSSQFLQVPEFPGTPSRNETKMANSKAKRPQISRSMSSFSKAVYSVENSSDVVIPQNMSKLKLDEDVKVNMKEDLRLIEQVKNEEVPEFASPETSSMTTIEEANRYSLWECGFGLAMNDMEPATVPDNKADFIKAIKGEMHTVKFVQNGLSKYMNAINSGEHHVFSEAFIRKQNTASQLALGQLFQINEHLQEVVAHLGDVEEDDDSEIEEELKELFSHAKPWISRTRSILVSSHVFYKVNYALAADARKTARPID